MDNKQESMLIMKPIVPMVQIGRKFISFEIVEIDGKEIIILGTKNYRILESYASKEFGNPNSAAMLVIQIIPEMKEEKE